VGDMLAAGITHFPPLMGPDAGFTFALERMLADPGMREELKDPANWPPEMRAEYGDDRGAAAAGAHRARVVEGLRRVRAAIDEFRPDVVLVWADDQYENFREGGVPAFCVEAFGDLVLHPWRDGEQARYASNNVWGEGPDDSIRFRGAPRFGKRMVQGLLDSGFDVSYAYEPQFADGLSHAFLNTLLYLDYDRRGFDYPVLPVAVNCYGRFVISHRGRFPDLTSSVEIDDLDPPPPQPWRCFDFGAACARIIAETGLRVAVVASSSWSHGFLTRKNHFLFPDVAADEAAYERFREGRFGELRGMSRDAIEQSGQPEILNWLCLAGAAAELGLEVAWSDLVTTRIYNSNKCFAVLR
jgi:hypothetical protein